ncbi:MAG TPA: NlpC/P60 family protein [Gaiellales bacterium]|nr:NlpC/P60 family protein [Gaiellales bacterium]
MRGRSTFLAAAVTALLSFAPPAIAAGGFSDVPSGFWARHQIRWAATNGWITPSSQTAFKPHHTVSRQNASRVLARVAYKLKGVPEGPDAFAQAVAANWIPEGAGPKGTMTQLEFDRALVRILGLAHAAKALNHLQTADGWAPRLPDGFGVEQEVRAIGARINVPDGWDSWELSSNDVIRRANVAAEAYQVTHLSSWAVAAGQAKVAVATQLPAWSPLQRKVLGLALRSSGSPYVWGGTSPDPQSPLGSPVAGGFDCSGFVWWVMKLHSYTVASHVWSGDGAIQARSTYDMAKQLPVSKRVHRRDLRPGDILFWSSAPNGVKTRWATVYHAGIYLGNGWAINSHGSGDGVTLDYMGAGAGWFHDAFAFAWRVMPRGR